MFKTLTIYDFETTGLATKFDVPLQFGAIEVDAQLNSISETEFRGRPPKHILPAPWALATTGTSIEEVLDAKLGFYEFMARVQKFIAGKSPTCLIAYNGMAFDEEVMRHSLYQSLHSPYITQFYGNSRADALKLVQATHMLLPGNIRVPNNSNGRPTFKLERIAQANGLESFDAHNALADCRATVRMLNLVKTRASEIWDLFHLWASKAALNELLKNSTVVVDLFWFGKAGKSLVHNVAPLVSNDSGTEWLTIDLNKDPETYLGLTVKELSETMLSRSRANPIRRIKTNAMPLVLPGAHDLAREHLCSDIEILSPIADALRSNTSFIERVQKAVSLYRETFEASERVEEQLYQPPFFPSDDDKAIIERFHRVSPAERYDLVRQLNDPRAKKLGSRLVLSEWPENASQFERDRYERFVRARLLNAEAQAKWTTVGSAFCQLAEIRNAGDSKSISIADGYERYLVNRFSLSDAAD